jgi:uncharacterized protein YyaL (SSP411 family)
MAKAMLAVIQPQAARYPTAFSQWLCALDDFFSGIREVAILGDPLDSRTQALYQAVWEQYRPSLVLAASTLPVPDNSPPLLYQRTLLNTLPTAYVCRNFVCLKPVNTPQELVEQLASASPKALTEHLDR